MKEVAFLRLAEALAASDRPEMLRSAVSRAYDAVFHVTSRLQEELGGKRVYSHEVLADRFRSSDHPGVKDIGERFSTLGRDRRVADYVLTGAVGREVERREEVMPIVTGARALFEDVDRLRGEPLRSAARQAVLDDDARRFGRLGR